MGQPYTESEIRRRFPGATIRGGTMPRRTADASPRKRRHKYNAQAVTIDGIRFDSKREAAHYELLKAQQREGGVKWFALKPVFVIEGGRYIPDFIVQYTYRIEIQDVKGFKTALYRRAKKQMRERYGIDVVEI